MPSDAQPPERRRRELSERDLASMRADYTGAVRPESPELSAQEAVAAEVSAVERDLEPEELAAGWSPVLRDWLATAVEAGTPEPNAMVLATVDGRGRPATRTVLCKGIDADGITFFTNYGSDKGRHLAAVPYASATFVWLPLHRQSTVRGRVVRVSAEETAEYWRTRPRGSRLGAWASHQSRPVTSRSELEHALVEAGERFGPGDDIPVPPFWGGFRIVPESVEFWQGRPDRLHNRIRTHFVDGRWVATRLQP